MENNIKITKNLLINLKEKHGIENADLRDSNRSQKLIVKDNFDIGLDDESNLGDQKYHDVSRKVY